jgi:hypothetical protein
LTSATVSQGTPWRSQAEAIDRPPSFARAVRAASETAAPAPNVRKYRQAAARVLWFLYSGGTTKTVASSVRSERTRSKNAGR